MHKIFDHKIIISVACLIAALCVGYYFVFALPKNNAEKLKFEREKYDNEQSLKALENDEKKQQEEKEIAKKIQDGCIEKTKNSVYFDFDSSNTTKDPLFYPYDDVSSFNKNERIVTALDAYMSCMTADPRYNKENKSSTSIYSDAFLAWMEIRRFMNTVVDKKVFSCSSYLLSASAKQKCEDFLVASE